MILIFGFITVKMSRQCSGSKKGSQIKLKQVFLLTEGPQQQHQLPVNNRNPCISSHTVTITEFELPLLRELGRKTYRCIDLGSFPLIDFLTLDELHSDGDVSAHVSAVSQSIYRNLSCWILKWHTRGRLRALTEFPIGWCCRGHVN